MSSTKKFKTVFAVILLYLSMFLMLYGGIWLAVNSNDYSLLITFAFFLVLMALGFVLGSWSRDYHKLMVHILGDHKLIGTHVSAVDVGNFRFLYHLYEKGSSMSPFNKTYLSLTVGIPFPIDNLPIKTAIKQELQSLISSLQGEGVLTDSSPIIDDEEVAWIGQPVILEFLFKRITANWLTTLHGKVIDIIDRYELQELTYCTINGLNSGSEYHSHNGNLLCSVVHRKTYGDSLCRYSYKHASRLYLMQYESFFSVDSFHELFESAISPQRELNIGNLEKEVKMMFKKTGTMSKVGIFYEKGGIKVNISIPSESAASRYHLIHSSDYWWIYADGKLENISPISIEDESFACDFFLKIISKYALGRTFIG
jgi:hypothetical protein